MRKMLLGLAAVLGIATASQAAPILIINGASQTSEPGTTAQITANLQALHVAAGNTVTIADAVPGSFAGFAQVWDIRFANASPISAGQQAQYQAYLAGGGSMFVMGENSGFMTRNNSVLALIANLGGGLLSFTSPASNQTVFPPANVPNAVNSVNYAAPGGVTTAGTGDFLTATAPGGPGTAIGFVPGDLSNAMSGRLAVVFDVNFMEGDRGVDQQNFLRNLIGFVGGQAIPEPLSIAVFGGLVAVGGLVARRRVAKVTA